MPNPKSGERRSDFVSRCVPVVMDEGIDQEAAVGKCEGIYDNVKKVKTLEKALKGIKEYISKAEAEENELKNEGRIIELLGENKNIYLNKGRDLFIKTYSGVVGMGGPEERAIAVAKKAVQRSKLIDKKEIKLTLFKTVEKCLKMIKE